MNKRTEQTRWTPKRLLSLLMALIMTLSLLPTAAFAADSGTAGSSADNPVTIDYTQKTYGYATAATSPITTQISEEGFTSYTVTFKPQIQFVDSSNNETANTFSYQSDIPFKPGVSISTNANEEKAIGQYTYTVQQVNADGTAVTNTTTVANNIGGTSKIPAARSLSCGGSDFSAKALENNMIRLKYTVYEGDSVDENKLVGKVYVGITGIQVTDIEYTITYRPGADAAWATPPTGLSETSESGVYATTVTPGEDGKASYTIDSAASVKKDGYTFVGWQVATHSPTGSVMKPGNTIGGIDGDVNLYAVFEKDYTITFQSEYSGASGLMMSATSNGTKYTVPVEPTMYGFTFAGWKVTKTDDNSVINELVLPGQEITGITEPVTLTAQWTKDGSTTAGSHSVKFVRNNTTDGSALNWPSDLTGAKDSTVTIPWLIPQAEGYTFLGWSTTENATTADPDYAYGKEVTIGDTDTSLYAVWRENMVSITYPTSLAGGKVTPGASSVKPGASVTFSVLIAAGYDASSVNVTANGIGLGAVNKTTAQNGVTTLTYTFNPTVDTTILVSAPKKLTYNVTLPISDTVDVSFTNPASDAKSMTVNYGSDVAFKVAARTGYTVKGVYANGQKLKEENGAYTIKDITADQRVTVDVEAIQFHKVTYVVLDKTYLVQDVQDGKTSTVEDPVVEGYAFMGWNTKQNGTGDTFTSTTTVNGNITVYAQLQAVTHQINYDLNAPQDANGNSLTVNPSTLPDTEKTYGKAVTLSAVTPTCDGYDFLGWAKGENKGLVVYAAGATVSEELTADMTLYAVWAKKTYTITLQGGSGYTVSSNQALVVEHGSDFTFTVTVDGAYAATEPVVTANGATPTKVSGEPNTKHEAATYTYKIENVTADQVVTVKVTENARATVTFQYRVVDAQGNEVTVTGLSGKTFMTQAVQLGDPAAQPQQPNIEGYKFVRWCGADHTTATPHTDYDFTKPVADELTIYAEITPILPVITVTDALNGTGWKTESWKHGAEGTETNAAITNNAFTIAYGDNVTFDLVIAKGYDYSKLSVTANGLALGYQSATTDEKTGVTTLHYYLGSVMADTRIAITGIERKTITINYFANAGDDVASVPGPQTDVKYYINETGVENSNIINFTPVRTGYNFLGWCENPAPTGEKTYNNQKLVKFGENAVYQPGDTATFTKDTNLYAIWEATELKVYLTFSDTALHTTKYDIQYEGKTFTLNAQLSARAKGSMIFKMGTTDNIDDAKEIGRVSNINGDSASLTVTTDKYITPADSNFKYYWVEFQAEQDEGFTDCTAGSIKLKIFSRAITWASLEKGNDNTLTIKQGNETKDSMIAGQTYTLAVDTSKITGLEALDSNKPPVLGKDYKIVWQYKKTATSDWETVNGEFTDTNEYQVTPAESGYEFRAKIYPMGDLYNTAAKFDADGKYLDNQYDSCLYTNTTKSNHQATATTLTIDAPEESKDIKINGTTPFTDIGEHKAQFEGQAVTLTATVTKDGGTGVETGKVSFYRLASTDATGAQTWELISTVDVQTAGDNTGVASTTYTMGAYDSSSAGASATTNKETFKAVYVANETYATSTTDGNAAVYIKSAKLMTPIIESKLAGKLDDTNKTAAQATTYKYNLTELLAGVQHTFTLRQTGAEATTGDWSVVALDGRTVDADNYSIEWQYKTGNNFVKANNESTQAAYTTTTTKVGDRYRVKLTGKGVFAGSEATSQDAVIGTKQDVTVTVKAIDAITKTPETDVYQLNEITLTATVAAAKGADATMKPTGTVTFYYKDGDNWVKLDSAMLAEDTNHSMTASITTNKLPVTDTTNTWRNVEITAVYEGNDTFNASGNYDATNSTVSAGTTANGVTDDTVTVYSSVVFNCNDENKKQPTDGDKGIHISVSDGAFKTNEKATLALSDIYTLDRELTDETLRNTIAKLNPTTDYTVQWQKLNGATTITSGDYGAAKNWTNIDGKTGTTLVLNSVEQNTAYRAVITVNDQPITKGSSTEVDQTIKGRQVYYSNVLMPTDTSMTVSVALNTSKIDAENTEGITEGETVTANVFLSGVVGVVPNANVTVKVTNDSAKGNNTAYEKTFTSMNTVNGWNAFSWNTAESDDKGVPTAPGFYTLTVSATTNTGYAAKEITRSLIVRESSYNIEVGNTNPTYNGHTQGLTVTLDGFDFKGTGINEAANKSWTVKYYVQKVEGLETGALVEPTQAGTYKAVITLPASAYWTEQRIEKTFTIKQRSVSIADAIAQAKVYDGTTDVNIVEVMLNDAETEQGTTGWLKSGENTGIINGDSIYAVATAASLNSANAGNNSFKISTIELRGDDANNYVWNEAPYTEDIYVSRSQVYGVSSTDVTLKAGEKLPADAVYMIDQAGNKITTYDVLYYLHTDTEIKKVDNTNEKGLYTVIVRPKQDNYKSGVTLKVTVGDTTSYTPAVAPKPSTLLYLSDTATKYNPAGNAPVTAKNAQGNAVKVEYQTGTTWSETVPSNAGRYLVKATDTNTGDVAYGIYTITKAHPSIDVTPATGLTYNSMPQNGYTGTPTVPTSAESYFTYAGDVAIGYNVQKEGNVDEQAPVDAGTYTVTLHVNETANYTAHEISKSFTIAKKALTIEADSWQTTQYDAFPDMTAGYTGLAAETGDTTPDTSLRDVQIAPEFLYNPTGGKSNYSNDSLDQVGGVAIQPIDAHSKNYAINYENGQYTKQRTETNVDFAIHGLPQSSTGKNTVYYGDEIQLYPYGYYTTHANGSGIFEWSVTTATGFKGMVKIGKETGLLNVNGVGEFTVTLKRGVGEQQIETKLTVTALKKEVKVHVADQDKVYSGSAQTYSGEVKAYDELYATVNAATTTPVNNTRTDIGTQITTSRIATGSEKYQSLVYGGKFTINDKDATVAPVAQSTVYGTLETFDTTPTYKVDGKAGSVDPVTGVNVASQTDAYNRLDVHDGYEILVAGAENMNYNVKYTTDETAEDSAVTTYQDVVFTSKTDKYLNDATIYSETPNVLDWTLVNVIGATRDSVDYADNLADFDLPDTFVEQDKDDCTGNKVTYKAANRTTEISGSTVEYNQAALTGPRTSTDTATDENYTLKFNTVENSGAANYKLTNDKTGNSATTTNALTANSKGFIPAAGESNDVSGENFVEGSANIAQRPIKLEKAVTDAQLYWRLPQSQLYTALVNILKAEENSVGRGLAKGHTIEDLDLSFTIGSTPVDKNDDQPMTGLTVGTQTVTVTVGDTNYKLEGSNTFEVDFQTMRIRATYYNKTFTGFDVRIEKIDAAGNSVGPLDSTKGLTFKVLKQTNGVLDTETDYAANKSFTFVSKDGTYGYFHGSYSQLPLLGNGELYVFQMYEYGVPLERK